MRDVSRPPPPLSGPLQRRRPPQMPVGDLLVGVGGGQHASPRRTACRPAACRPAARRRTRPARPPPASATAPTSTPSAQHRGHRQRVALGDQRRGPAHAGDSSRSRSVQRLHHPAAPDALALAALGVPRAGDRRAAAQARRDVGGEALRALRQPLGVERGGLGQHQLGGLLDRLRLVPGSSTSSTVAPSRSSSAAAPRIALGAPPAAAILDQSPPSMPSAAPSTPRSGRRRSRRPATSIDAGSSGS